MNSNVVLFLSGDVMTGRGIDQVLARPGDPTLYEDYVHDARDYVSLAEQMNGPIPHGVDGEYPWGDALHELDRRSPDVRIVNLETSITRSDEHWPGKLVHYRMHPDNIGVLTAARIDCCALANNHVMDWGQAGLVETLASLQRVHIASAGAGRNSQEAAAPAALPHSRSGRVLVFALAARSSGVPSAWRAEASRPGVCLLESYSDAEVERIGERVRRTKGANDIAVASLHWGGNWGYAVPKEHVDFAHKLIDRAAVDVVHGHSSHHPMHVEIHHGRLVLFGCGDLLNDYEGIAGHAEYRPGLAFLYFAAIEVASGQLARLDLFPMRIRRLRLEYAAFEDAQWLFRTLGAHGGWPGARADLETSGTIVVTPR
jgi:poly-gamma-glutamate synthesis protein (capsule biosynthesis protein)